MTELFQFELQRSMQGFVRSTWETVAFCKNTQEAQDAFHWHRAHILREYPEEKLRLIAVLQINERVER